MKKYKVNAVYKVNKQFSKKGYRFEYRGMVSEDKIEMIIENYKRSIESLEKWKDNERVITASMLGIRITDKETNEVVFEHIAEEYLKEKTDM